MNYCKCGKLIPDNERVCDGCAQKDRLPPWMQARAERMQRDPDDVKCPKCGSHSFFAHKRGFSSGRGCLTALIMMPLGLFTMFFGLLGAMFGANKIKKTCNNCGHRW